MAKLTVYGGDEYLGDIVPLCAATMKVLKQRCNFYVDLTFLTKKEMQELNKAERSVDSVTDVLSFPMLDGIRGKTVYIKDFPLDYDEDEKAIFLGSVAICPERAKEQAKEYGHSEEREFKYLLVHSLLHLFGYDHLTDEDKKEMREKEEIIMNEIGVTE